MAIKIIRRNGKYFAIDKSGRIQAQHNSYSEVERKVSAKGFETPSELKRFKMNKRNPFEGGVW